MKLYLFIFSYLLSTFSFASNSYALPYSGQSSDFEWDILPERPFAHEIRSLRNDRLKIFWWNIKYGDFSKRPRKRKGRKVSPLENNLRILARDPQLRPQILVLGEFHSRALTEQTQAILRSFYPYQNFLPMNPQHPEIGEMVYSQIKPETVEQISLPWYPQKYRNDDPALARSTAETKAFIKSWSDPYPVHTQYFERQLNQIRFFFRGFTFDLFPLHLVQPWFGYTFGENATWGILPVITKGREIIWGMDNPLWYQVDAMRRTLAHRLGRRYAQKQYIILLGDLNLPSRLPQSGWGFSPELYERAKGFMKDPLENTSQFSFPAAGTDFNLSRFKNRVRIDHAFISQPLQADFAEILPIAGSDHYPVYISVYP